MPSDQIHRATIEEWRELGFYYEVDTLAQAWILVGSRSGLLEVCQLLETYVADPRHAKIGEHDQFKPYYYLTFRTENEPGIHDHCIHGSLEDLGRLASLISAALESGEAGTRITIRDAYATTSPYSLVLDIREDGFDPATADPQLPRHLL